MKKKILSFVLAFLFVLTSVFSLAACDKKDTTNQNATNQTNTNNQNNNQNVTTEDLLTSAILAALNNSTADVTIVKSLTTFGETSTNAEHPETITMKLVSGKTYEKYTENDTEMWEEDDLGLDENLVNKALAILLNVCKLVNPNAITTTATTNGVEVKVTLDLTNLANNLINIINENHDKSLYVLLNTLLNNFGYNKGISGLLEEAFAGIDEDTKIEEIVNALGIKLGITNLSNEISNLLASSEEADTDSSEAESSSESNPTAVWETLKTATLPEALAFAKLALTYMTTTSSDNSEQEPAENEAEEFNPMLIVLDLVDELLAYDETTDGDYDEFLTDTVDNFIQGLTEGLTFDGLFEMAGGYIIAMAQSMGSSNQEYYWEDDNSDWSNEYEENGDVDNNQDQNDDNDDYLDESNDDYGQEYEDEDPAAEITAMLELIKSYLINGSVKAAKIEQVYVVNTNGKLVSANVDAHFKATIVEDVDEDEADEETDETAVDPYLIDARYQVNITFSNVGATTAPATQAE